MKCILNRWDKTITPFFNDNIKVHEQFIYIEELDREEEFCLLAIKIDNDYCALVNHDNKFILGEVHDHYISIKNGEYDSFNEAEDAIKGIRNDSSMQTLWNVLR